MNATPTPTAGAVERDVTPHELSIWRTIRDASLPGDVIRTSILPPWQGPVQYGHSEWLRELAAALDQGIEIRCEECGSLRHGMAVLRAVQRAVEQAEAEVKRREAQARQEVAEAKAELEEEYQQGYRHGMEAAQIVQKASTERAQARERQRRKRQRDAAEQAEKDAQARRDPSSPHFQTSATA